MMPPKREIKLPGIPEVCPAHTALVERIAKLEQIMSDAKTFLILAASIASALGAFIGVLLAGHP